MKKLMLLLFVVSLTYTTTAQEQFGTGLLFDETKYNEVPESVPLVTRSFTALPKSYSLKAYAPTPKSQGSQGSCVGWASSYGARTIAYAIRKGWKNQTAKITQNAFSPSFVYNLIKVNTKCQGAYIENAMKVMNSYGTAKLTDFPYDYRTCMKNPSSYVYTKAKDNKILTFERLARWDNPYNLVGKVKKAISKKNPVVIGMFKYGSLYGKGDLWVAPPNPNRGGHAMVVVGYDDYKYGGAFEIMNSWGSNFRNGGFFWVRYNDFKKYIKTAYVLVDKRDYNNFNNNNNNNNNNNTFYTYNKLGGELTLKLADGSNMPISLSKGATRNFNIVKATNTETTYKVNQTYSSGTQFRIYLNSKQRGYVYLIGYGSYDKSVNKLYPFGGYSDFFNYTNSEIAIPNEDYFIEFDNKPGRDILCVLYSKEKLNINDIVSKARYGSGDFVSRIKRALSYKMFKGSDVKFSSNKISFSATSNSSSAKVVPIFISMNHK